MDPHTDIKGHLTAADIVRAIWLLAVDRYGNPVGHPEPTLDTLAKWLAECRWSLPIDTDLFRGARAVGSCDHQSR